MAVLGQKPVNSPNVDFISNVRSLVECRTANALSRCAGAVDTTTLIPGKMLRTRLAARVCASVPEAVDQERLQAVCAAVELVHTASLCHDDVVDNSLVRRSTPTLWRTSGQSVAILVGDLLLCEGLNLLIEADEGFYLPAFLAKLTEVVQAEAEQELLWRGKLVDPDRCLQLARGKTGSLFGFVAQVCGGSDEALCAALEEAGYRIGTAYQLADDLVDLVGSEDAAGKTLGTDHVRGKYTIPESSHDPHRITLEHVRGLCVSALELLEAYPDVHEALSEFLIHDIQPVLSRQLNTSVEIAI